MTADDRLELRIPADVKARWQAAAAERGVKLAELVRGLVERGLTDDDEQAGLADLARDVVDLVHSYDAAVNLVEQDAAPPHLAARGCQEEP